MISNKKNFSEDIYSLKMVIECIEDALKILKLEFKKPISERSGIFARILKDYIVVKTYILFEKSNKNNISFLRLHSVHRKTISYNNLNKYKEALGRFIEKHNNEIERIGLQRNKAIAHLDRGRFLKFGFNKKFIEFIGVELREATEAKFEYIQAEELITMPLLLDLKDLVLVLEIVEEDI